ncbi:MAG: sensor hybrid histidine kinase [Firmicutes bacterium]|nr:sensor hybrid histidine kinase [Bacillota bacterium]
MKTDNNMPFKKENDISGYDMCSVSNGFLDNFIDIVLIVNNEGRILYGNKKALETYGYTYNELITKSIIDIRREEEYLVNKQLQEAMQNGIEFKTYHYKKDGTKFPVEVKSVYKDERVKNVVVSIIRDITDMVILSKTARMFSEAMDIFDDTIVGLTKDFEIFLWSKGAELKLGYSKDEIIGKNIKLLVPEDKFNEYETKIMLVREGKIIDKLETKRLHKKGHYIDVSISLAPLFNDRGDFNGAIGIYKDISEKIELAKRLKEQEERWRLALQGGSFCVWDYFLESKKLSNYGKWKEILGYNEDELSDNIEDLSELIHPEDRADAIKLYNNNSAQDYLKEYRIKCKNNDYKWIRTKGRVFEWDEYGKPSRIVGTHEDVTSRKVIEEEIREKCIQLEFLKQEADNANKAKSLFLANMSHEIRTPINGIIGTVQLLQLTNLTYEQERYAKRLKEAADTLLLTINDILDISRIESNNLSMNQEAFDLRDTIRKVYDILLINGNAKDLEISLSIDPAINYGLIGDEHRLMQVLNNLTSNAIKFTDKGKISFRIVKVCTTNNKERIDFIIQDTGIGIEDSYKEKIFHSFSQGDLSYEKKYLGSGLGLAIAKSIALLMGGDIIFTSKIGEGSKFVFTGEFEISETQMKQNQEGIPVNNKNKLGPQKEKVILIVDDNLINQEIVQNLIQRKEYHFIAAYNGREALDIVRKQEVDLILMDIQMPALNGLETAKIIRTEMAEKKHIPIIAITAYAMSEDEEKCKEAGMDSYISKPFELEAFYRMIELYLG